MVVLRTAGRILLLALFVVIVLVLLPMAVLGANVALGRIAFEAGYYWIVGYVSKYQRKPRR